MGYPSRNDHAACAYSRLDFESDDEFSLFIQRLRVDLLDTIRFATSITPTVTYNCVRSWLKTQLNKPLQDPSTQQSSVILEWEALTVMLDCVISRTVNSKNGTLTIDLPGGMDLLKSCLACNSSDPFIFSALLSCISALFVFVQQDNQILIPVLDKIFAAMVFNLPGQTKESRSRAVRNVRRHACSLMVKISRQFPKVLLPIFDHLKSTIEALDQSDDMSRMERVTLQEALLIISNQFNNFEFQSTFIGKVIQPAADQWSAMSTAFDSCHAFMNFVGLDQPPVEPSTQDINGRNRSELLYLSLIHISEPTRPY